jgi:acyl-ACP thioesterase
MRDIWQETFLLRFGGIDNSGRLTLWSTFDYFQDAALGHAEELGVGRSALETSGQVWVLSRLSVFLGRRPKYGERITVRSWPRGWEKLFAVRDYDIRDEEDKPVVRGRSGWVILDLEKRRPLRVGSIVDPLPKNEGINAFSAIAPGLAARDNLIKAGERRAAYSDIDYNGHVNNTRYIQWIQDITGPEVLEHAEQMRLDVNFLSEVKMGEVTELRMADISAAVGTTDVSEETSVSAKDYPARIDEAKAYEGCCANSTQPCFRAELRIKKDQKPGIP